MASTAQHINYAALIAKTYNLHHVPRVSLKSVQGCAAETLRTQLRRDVIQNGIPLLIDRCDDTTSLGGARAHADISNAFVNGDLIQGSLPDLLQSKNYYVTHHRRGGWTPAHVRPSGQIGLVYIQSSSDTDDQLSGGRTDTYIVIPPKDEGFASTHFREKYNQDLRQGLYFAPVMSLCHTQMEVYIVQVKRGDLIIIPPGAVLQIEHGANFSTVLTWVLPVSAIASKPIGGHRSAQAVSRADGTVKQHVQPITHQSKEPPIGMQEPLSSSGLLEAAGFPAAPSGNNALPASVNSRVHTLSETYTPKPDNLRQQVRPWQSDTSNQSYTAAPQERSKGLQMEPPLDDFDFFMRSDSEREKVERKPKSRVDPTKSTSNPHIDAIPSPAQVALRASKTTNTSFGNDRGVAPARIGSKRSRSPTSAPIEVLPRSAGNLARLQRQHDQKHSFQIYEDQQIPWSQSDDESSSRAVDPPTPPKPYQQSKDVQMFQGFDDENVDPILKHGLRRMSEYGRGSMDLAHYFPVDHKREGLHAD